MGTKPHKGLLRGYYLYNSKHSIKIKGCYPQAQFVDYQAMPPEQKQQPNQNPPATPKIAIRTMKTDMDEYLKTARPSLGSMIAQTSAGLASDEERETNKLPAIIIFSVIGVAVLGGGAFFVSQFLKEGKVIGHFAGRTEFGPRALGSRSILGDPRNREVLGDQRGGNRIYFPSPR